jgi:hypothetical protein
LLCHGQQFNLDQFYSSTYEPDELNVRSSVRLDSIYHEYALKKNVGLENEEFKSFVYDYNFFLDQLNKSGEVFYGDDISKYLNDLKDQILADHPNKKTIKVFLTNYSELNAFTNDFGNIYVNICTVAKLDSEEELMVILAHEISHVLLEHSYRLENSDLHIDNDESVRDIGAVNELEKHRFSRKHELEADSLAFVLLKKVKLDHSAFVSSFHKLKSYGDPIFKNKVQLNYLFMNDSSSIAYFQSVLHKSETLPIKFHLDTSYLNELKNDELSTHPSINQRLESIDKLVDTTIVSINRDNEYFEYVKDLAIRVYLRKLIQEGNYIEALYLTVGYRNEYPDDLFLIKSQLKLMLLLTQSKYHPKAYNQVINEYGNACSNQNYLHFRDVFLRIPALELNILTSIVLEKSISQYNLDSSYVLRMIRFSDQFLYKNTNSLFIVKDEKFMFNEYFNGSNGRVMDLNFYYNTETSIKKDENEGIGFLFADTLTPSFSLIGNYVTNYSNYQRLNNNILKFKIHRDQFENTLTLDEFILSFNFEEVYSDYRKGNFVYFNPISDTSRIALVQSDTYVLLAQPSDTTIVLEKTLLLDEKISAILEEGNYFDLFVTNRPINHRKISVLDNQMHYVLNQFIDDCWNLSELIYSSVDEEVLRIAEDNNIDYLTYNINFSIETPNRLNHHSILYSLYFDINTMGVVYISKIASKQKLTEKMLKHFFYSSHQGKGS